MSRICGGFWRIPHGFKARIPDVAMRLSHFAASPDLQTALADAAACDVDRAVAAARASFDPGSRRGTIIGRT